MPEITTKPDLSRSLEDYLIAVWRVIQEKQFARVKDVASFRGVKPGSVSPAMAKLAKLQLIAYERREFILLTPQGASIAQNLIRRRRLLVDFFEDILQISTSQSQEQACAMEHCLTEQATNRLAELMQFVRSSKEKDVFRPQPKENGELTISSMSPGQEATVRLIRAQGEMNHQLIDMGLLPDSKIRLVNISTQPIPTFLVALQGFQITLTSEQARAVVVSA